MYKLIIKEPNGYSRTIVGISKFFISDSVFVAYDEYSKRDRIYDPIPGVTYVIEKIEEKHNG